MKTYPTPRWNSWTLFAAILLLLGGISSSAASAQSELPAIRFVRDPDPAPGFKLKDFDGHELTLEDAKGKVVLLNFWATWCGPCRAEIPGLIALQKRYADKVRIIGLLVDEDDDKEARAVASSEGINYPLALADVETRVNYGGISALPTVFLINSDGKVVQKHVGLYNPSLYELEIRALLGLPVPVRVETFDDQGDIFLKHADRAKALPGVDLSKLSEEQRDAAFKKFNAESCDCGCKFTLAQCRIYDPACRISQERTAAIVKQIVGHSATVPKDKDASRASDTPLANDSSPSPGPAKP